MSAVRTALVGLAGTLAAAALWSAQAGRTAGIAAAVAGSIATGAQTVAHAWAAALPKDAGMTAVWRRHLHGTALRVGAAGVVVALVVKDRETFPPLASVLTVAGVLFGLMALEIRSRA